MVVLKFKLIIMLIIIFFANYTLLFGQATASNQINEELKISFWANYNTYQLHRINHHVSLRGGQKINSGPGGRLMISRNFSLDNSNRLSTLLAKSWLGLEVEYMQVNYNNMVDNSQIILANFGILSNLSYQLADGFAISSSVGQYITKVNSYGREFKDSVVYSPGFKLGVKQHLATEDGVDIKAAINYRFVNNNNYDFSGFELGLSATKSF